MVRAGTQVSPQHALVAQGLKRCTTCGEVKKLGEFFKHRSAVGGVDSNCKLCVRLDTRARSYKRLYGITPEEYNALLKKQKGVCAICEQPPRSLPSRTIPGDVTATARLHVDHDHDTGAVRALLCTSCNRGIGLLKHDIALLQAAIEYLRQPRLF